MSAGQSKVNRVRASTLAIARVLPLLQVAHLDRDFDYQVSQDQDIAAQPGVRVRIRFGGRLVDGIILDRLEKTEHQGKLAWLDRVLSEEQVLTPEIRELVSAVAARYAGTRADVIRLAIPPRHAKAEAEQSRVATELESVVDPAIDSEGWRRYVYGEKYLAALLAGRAPRAVWQALPGEDWSARLAELAVAIASQGRGALIIVPDQRDLDLVHQKCIFLTKNIEVVALSAGLGPAARYRRWLSILRGEAKIVVGTRSAVFAPIHNLGLVVLWDDGDDSLSEPRAPYPHAREVALLRAHTSGTAALLGGFARTVEAQSLVETGWAQDLIASRQLLRAAAPRITALEDSDFALSRDPAAHAARLPTVAFDAARAALKSGTGVLVQVPRRGYVPSLVCTKCRTPARCRRCNGPLAIMASSVSGSGSPQCRWCGFVETAFRCKACAARTLRASVFGTRRTAEELGRAFPGVPILTCGGDEVITEVKAGPMVVVSTPGTEPTMPGGYGAALLLDAWALLGRADIRASEETLRRWMSASALVCSASVGGQVVVVADSQLATVQSLVRWDPVGHAAAELRSRAEVRFPPAVHMAAIDGSAEGIAQILDSAQLSTEVEILGPVDLPNGSRMPFAVHADSARIERILLRVPRGYGAALAEALSAAQAVRSARKEQFPVRVQMDPLHIG
ncbi:MAG: primosomal protein N' [Mycobacteriaceae bacterium]